MNIAGKNIVLTGASSGIGLEILKQLLSYDDVRIVAVARNIETIPAKSGVVFPFSADLSSQEGVDSLFDYAYSVLGAIDIFIANAGFAYMEKMHVPDWKHIEHIFALNTFSPIYSLQKLAEGNHGKEHFFVCMASAVAVVPLSYYSLYTSTKSAIHQFLDTYRYEKESNLRTMTVYPVATRTSFFEKAAKSTQPPVPFLTQSPQTVAKSILKGIERNKQKLYPSTLFRIFYAFGRVFPFVFRIYSWNEKRKAEKYFELQDIA